MTEPKPPAEPTPVPPPETEAPAPAAPATPDEAPDEATATPAGDTPATSADAVPAPPEADEVTEPVALDADAVAELMPAEEAVDAAPPPAPVPVTATTPPIMPPSSPPPAAPPVAPPAAVPVVTTTPPAPAPVAAPVAATPAVVAEPPKKRTALGTISRIVAFLFGILQALLILRIVLLLLIANPDNDVVSWVLSVTDPFVEPFRGIFQLDEITGERGAVLDVAAIVALIAWSLIETLILSVMRLIGRRG